jgi:ubiquinone/menaquinone biosynthesis C-methylase UbiE
MKNQTTEFEEESFRYVSSYLDAPPHRHFLLDEEELKKAPIKNILDVGCGNGLSLLSLCDGFSAKGVGVEPSKEAITLLKNKYSQKPSLSFESASVHSLPFESDTFDLVTIWSVLHWVGRNEYLQALGELIRVTSDYLVVMDFVASEDYRVPYHHNSKFFTYKTDFEDLVLKSRIMKKVAEKRYWATPGADSVEFIKESQLTPFLGNHLSYHARKLVIFKKDYDLLPIFQESDF